MAALLKNYELQRTFKIKSDIDYKSIMELIGTNNTNRVLRGIVSTCKANNNVVFLIYRYGCNEVLLVCGQKPTTMIMPGDKLERILSKSVEYGYIYGFCYLKK
jgi:hypothetical protein